MLRRLFVLVLLLCALGGAAYGVRRMLRVEQPMDKAKALVAKKDIFGAQVALRGIIRTDSRNPEAHLLLAQTQIATADWLSAEKEAKTLRALGYDRTVVSPMLVRSYAAQGRYQDILTDIPAVAIRPEEQAMNLALRSQAYLGLGDVAQAQATVDAAAALSPDAFLVHAQKARIALTRKNVDVTLSEADAALKIRPNSTEAYRLRSEARLLRQDVTGAIAEMDHAVDISPMSQDLRMERAGLLISLGLDKQAQEDVNAVFDLTSSNPRAQFYNALLMMRTGAYADANVEFDKLGPAMDQFPRAYFYKAQIALQLGNRQSALESLDRLIKLVPGDGDAMHLAAQVEIGDGRPQRALNLLAPATGPSTRDAIAMDLQGRAYFMLGRMAEAVESYRRASRLAPENREFAAHLSAAQTQFGTAPVEGETIDDPAPSSPPPPPATTVKQ